MYKDGKKMASDDESTDISVRLEQALAPMSSADLARLYRVAQYYLLSGTTFQTPRELFNEAIRRTLEGSRYWPPDVPFAAYILMVMRSISSAERKAVKVEVLANDLPITSAEVLDSDRIADPDQQVPGTDLVLEAQRIHEQHADDLRIIEDHFKDDPDVTLAIMAIEDNIPPRELESDYGLAIKQYEYARKKLRRFVDRQFPGRRKV